MFTSKALTDTQSRYFNIEREMLAVVFGCERFQHLLYGNNFYIVTDLKPLITICKKAIHSAPARLQRMLLRIQGYDFQISYRLGSQMNLADVLPRLPNTTNNGCVDLDTRIDTLEIDISTNNMRNFALINVS